MKSRLILSFAFLVFNCATLSALDKSAVKPQSISLPSGPGSIEGLGESFEPQLNSGTFNYSIPLKLPAIRGGAPILTLTYSSGAGNGMLGMGWQIKFPYVRRQTEKGLPRYADGDLFIDENAEELVALADGFYRQKIESAFIRYKCIDDAWIGQLRNGSTLRFGEEANSRLQWRTNGTFAWMLSSAEDPNGNRTEYSYFEDAKQIYPAEIRYGLHKTESSDFFRVTFGYDTNRMDAFIDCRPRFASTNRLRLNAITVWLGEHRVRHWRLDYATNAPVSLLSSVTMFGDDRAQTNDLAEVNRDFLPPTSFGYTRSDVGTTWRMFTNRLGFVADFNSGEAEFADLNHDGLPDVLLYDANERTFYSSLNPGGRGAWPTLSRFTSPAFYPPLNAPTTRLVDLAGDGRTKVLIKDIDGDGLAFYFRDFKSGTEVGPDIDFRFPAHFPLDDANVQFIDINGDKSMDLIATDGDSFAFLINGQSNGKSERNWFLPDPPPPPGGSNILFSNGWRLADMNGDRLLDLVHLQASGIGTDVSLNLGWGHFADIRTMEGGPEESEISDQQLKQLQLVDINQDGLSDLVLVDSGRVRAWLNENGSRWRPPIVINDAAIPNVTAEDVAVRFADMNGNGSTDIVWLDRGSLGLRFLDLNSGGKAWLLSKVKTTLGRQVDIQYRSSTEYMLDAQGTTNEWTSFAPFPIPVVSQLVDSDGRGNFYTNQFTYRNAYYDGLEREFRGFEQAIKRELGNEDQGAPTLVTRFAFDTGASTEALKGKILRVETQTDSGASFYIETNTWTSRVFSLPAAPGEVRPVTFAFQKSRVTQEIELGPASEAVTLEQEFDYDDYGNQIRFSDYGRVENGDRAAWNDECVIVRCFSAQYPTGTNLWLLDRLVQEEKQDINGNVVARQQRFYDDETFSGDNLGTITKGNLTLQREWVDIETNRFRATVRNAYDLYGNVTTTYDPLGIVGRKDSGHLREIQFDDRLHTFPVVEKIYTGNPDAKAAGEAEPLLSMRASYDLGLGVITNAVDFNSNQTTFAFDTFGRLSAITKPYDTTNFPTAEFRYILQAEGGNAPALNWTETRLREIAGLEGTFDSRTYFDGLGRKLMTRTEGETNGAVVVSNAAIYNQRRSPWKTFLPYFDSGTLGYRLLVETNAFQETHYDALGRSTLVFQPLTKDDTTRPFSRTIYGPLSRLVQDEEQTKPDSPHFGAAMRYFEDGLRDKDGKGRLRIVQEIVKLTDDGFPSPNTNIWTTTYRYDLLDNFLGYTDSQNNEKEFRYDALSRKVFMDDPDRGHMTWIYDDASTLKESIDAKDQHVLYTYDGANRLLTEKYLDGKPQPPWRPASLNPQLSTNFTVIYHYDVPAAEIDLGDTTRGTPKNTKGMLAWVEDLSGEEHTSYDARGRVDYVVKRIPDLEFLGASNVPPANYLVSYKTALTYDSLDRIDTLIYPDNDQISYRYNPRNLLQKIIGGVEGLTRNGEVIGDIHYRASGQLERIDYGNGVRTSYGYDPRLRLNSLKTISQPGALDSQLINFGYTFDAASNIERIDDNRPAQAAPEGDKRRNTQIFAYDDLYRITSVQYSFNLPGQPIRNDGQINYHYDRIGNMLAQTSTIEHFEKGLSITDLGRMDSGGSKGRFNRKGRLTGEDPGPHALSRISNSKSAMPFRSYGYDPNGNMTNIDGLACTWDLKDRLVAVENAEMHAEYLYDYSDRRITKRVTPKEQAKESLTTSYINKYFEVRDYDAPVKYVWNGETRVARVTGSLSSNQRVQRLRLWQGWNLLSTALNVSSSQILNLNTVITRSFRWNQPTLNWLPLATNENLSAGTVVWLQSVSNGIAIFLGAGGEFTHPTLPSGASFQPAAGLEALALANPLPGDLAVWTFKAESQQWLDRNQISTQIASAFPAHFRPGEAIMCRSPAQVATKVLETPGIHFYHHDHLGSASALTDGSAILVQSSGFYPFGVARIQEPPTEAYGFAQKERDNETRFHYFEARFLIGSIGRFMRYDPVENSDIGRLTVPQSANLYSYCYNRPIIAHDPSGKTMERLSPLGAIMWIVSKVADFKSVDDFHVKQEKIMSQVNELQREQWSLQQYLSKLPAAGSAGERNYVPYDPFSTVEKPITFKQEREMAEKRINEINGELNGLYKEMHQTTVDNALDMMKDATTGNLPISGGYKKAKEWIDFGKDLNEIAPEGDSPASKQAQ